jgi:hypothetical protein
VAGETSQQERGNHGGSHDGAPKAPEGYFGETGTNTTSNIFGHSFPVM